MDVVNLPKAEILSANSCVLKSSAISLAYLVLSCEVNGYIDRTPGIPVLSTSVGEGPSVVMAWLALDRDDRTLSVLLMRIVSKALRGYHFTHL